MVQQCQSIVRIYANIQILNGALCQILHIETLHCCYFLVMPYISSVGRVVHTNKRKANCLKVETLYVMIYFYRMELLTVDDSSN
jgi:hypothetical protein